MSDISLWILVAVLICVAIITAVWWIRYKRKAQRIHNSEDNATTLMVPVTEELQSQEPMNEMIIFENVALLSDDENSRLMEVTDKNLISRIDNVIPGTLQVLANAGAIHQYQQAVQSAGQLYQAIIPKGAVLTNSKTMEGAVRGFYRGAENIQGQANLVAVDGNMGKGLAGVSAANAVMGVAAMVVGQYYMTQINDKLEKLSKGIEDIRAFLDSEYRGRVCALVAGVQKLSVFRTELLENDVLRMRELGHLSAFEDECIKLLGQANNTLVGCSQKTGIKYDEYETIVRQAQKWYQYQQILLELLGRIEELSYALNLGAVSKEYCYNHYTLYAKQSENALSQLNSWHIATDKRLKIDVDSARMRRKGVSGFLMNAPALFDDNLHYKK